MKSNSRSYVSFRPNFSNPLAIWAFSLISAIEGKVFTVYFTKRTDGTTRRMVCYWSESFPITKRGWDPSKKQLLNVFDIEKGDYRFISMDAVEKIVIGGSTYHYEEQPAPQPTPINSYLPSPEAIQRAINTRNKTNELLGVTSEPDDYYSFLVNNRESSFSHLKHEMHALFN